MSEPEGTEAAVKYPFASDGRWSIRVQVPYRVYHQGQRYAVLADTFARPAVHGRLRILKNGERVATHENLTPGDAVEITGDIWRVTAVDYDTRMVLERVDEDRGIGADA